MKTLLTLGAVGGLVSLALVSWSQIKKFNTYRIKQQIAKLEEKRDEVEGHISKVLGNDGMGIDSDTWYKLHTERETYNRDILKLRQRIG